LKIAGAELDPLPGSSRTASLEGLAVVGIWNDGDNSRTKSQKPKRLRTPTKCVAIAVIHVMGPSMLVALDIMDGEVQ
jgi:hypothetical protein